MVFYIFLAIVLVFVVISMYGIYLDTKAIKQLQWRGDYIEVMVKLREMAQSYARERGNKQYNGNK